MFKKNVHDNASDGKWFKYKTKIIENTEEKPRWPDSYQDRNQDPQPPIPPLNTEVGVPWKYLSNICKSLY